MIPIHFTGIVSVTFRKLKPPEIISLVTRAGLEAIEWGGDVHIPPGDLDQARKVRCMSDAAGLQIASYGSYYKVGCDSDFSPILETAIALGAPSIRIWAGNRGSAAAEEAWWHKVVEETKHLSHRSRQCGIRLSFEFHNHTLADNRESAMRLMHLVNDCNVSLYWQPQLDKDAAENLQVLTSLTPWISNIHVFHYVNNQQLSLREGEQYWRQYLKALPAPVSNRYIMLEFVKNGEPEQFIRDAQVLKDLVQEMKSERAEN